MVKSDEEAIRILRKFFENLGYSKVVRLRDDLKKEIGRDGLVYHMSIEYPPLPDGLTVMPDVIGLALYARDGAVMTFEEHLARENRIRSEEEAMEHLRERLALYPRRITEWKLTEPLRMEERIICPPHKEPFYVASVLAGKRYPDGLVTYADEPSLFYLCLGGYLYTLEDIEEYERDEPREEPYDPEDYPNDTPTPKLPW